MDELNKQRGYPLDVDIKKLFMLFLGIGILSIILDIIFRLPLYLGLILPIMCLLLFIFAGHHITEMTAQRDEVADSGYYMGFVFTLIAMIASLFELKTSSIGALAVVEEFGLALVTTVIGLVSKIYLTSFTGRLDPSKKAASRALQQNTRKFISLLNKNSTAIDSQYESMKGSVMGMHQEMQASILKTSELANEQLKSSSTGFSQSLQTAANEVSQKLASFQVPDDLLANEVQPALKQLSDELNKYSSSVKRQTDNSDRIIDRGKKIDEALLKMDDFSNAIQKVTSAYNSVGQEIEKSREAFEKQLEQMKLFSQFISSAERSIRESTNVHSNLSARIISAEENMDKYNLAVTRMTESANIHNDLSARIVSAEENMEKYSVAVVKMTVATQQAFELMENSNKNNTQSTGEKKINFGARP